MEFIFFGRLTLNKKTNRKDWCHIQLEKGSWHAKTNWSGLVLSHQGPLCSSSAARSCCWHQSSSWPVYASISLVFWLAVLTFLHRNTHCSMPNGPMQVGCTKITEYPYDCLVNQHTIREWCAPFWDKPHWRMIWHRGLYGNTDSSSNEAQFPPLNQSTLSSHPKCSYFCISISDCLAFYGSSDGNLHCVKTDE